jgi:hypothetical protein
MTLSFSENPPARPPISRQLDAVAEAFVDELLRVLGRYSLQDISKEISRASAEAPDGVQSPAIAGSDRDELRLGAAQRSAPRARGVQLEVVLSWLAQHGGSPIRHIEAATSIGRLRLANALLKARAQGLVRMDGERGKATYSVTPKGIAWLRGDTSDVAVDAAVGRDAP